MLLWSRWRRWYDDEQLEWNDPWTSSCSPCRCLQPVESAVMLMKPWPEHSWKPNIQCQSPLWCRLPRQPTKSSVYLASQSSMRWSANREGMGSPGSRISDLLLNYSLLQIDPSKLPCLAQWKREYTMETVLLEIRRWEVFRCAMCYLVRQFNQLTAWE